MVYVGVSARILVNVEALNMSESVGNVVRHKRAPIVVPIRSGGSVKYVLRYVPVISGESVAHGYQVLLAELAAKKGLPVCPLCRIGTFVKHASSDIFDELKRLGAGYVDELAKLVKAKMDTLDKIHVVEKAIISNCIVEDVGGFLFTDLPAKRTSRFYSGYIIPSLAYSEAVATEAQFHVRHDVRPERGRQAIYYVEAGSALYALNVALDLDGIGCTSAVRKEEIEGREERVRLAIEALAHLVSGLSFGAKKTRFLPHWEIESLVVTISHPLPFNPQPGHSDSYIRETVKLAKGFVGSLKDTLGKGYVKIYYYMSKNSSAEKPGEGAEEASTPMDAIRKALNYIEDSKCS